MNLESPNSFNTMDIPIVPWRGIEEQDRSGAPLIAVINETLVRIYFSQPVPRSGGIFSPEFDPIPSALSSVGAITRWSAWCATPSTTRFAAPCLRHFSRATCRAGRTAAQWRSRCGRLLRQLIEHVAQFMIAAPLHMLRRAEDLIDSRAQSLRAVDDEQIGAVRRQALIA